MSLLHKFISYFAFTSFSWHFVGRQASKFKQAWFAPTSCFLLLAVASALRPTTGYRLQASLHRLGFVLQFLCNSAEGKFLILNSKFFIIFKPPTKRTSENLCSFDSPSRGGVIFNFCLHFVQLALRQTLGLSATRWWLKASFHPLAFMLHPFL